jgi:putative toxin-antitoxin system antitoxin component (TIGR02293 family)
MTIATGFGLKLFRSKKIETSIASLCFSSFCPFEIIIIFKWDKRKASMLIEASKIAKVLGGEEKLGVKIASFQDLEVAIDRGLPSELVDIVVGFIYPDNAESRYQLVPRSTLMRRLKAKQLLTPDESQKLERVARIYAMAVQVWEDESDAREFMVKPHPMLRDKTPFAASLSELGARQVEEILGRLYYGSAA